MGSYERGVLQSLARSDKWVLGGDGPFLWAPGSPIWLEKPGFWDAGQFYRHQIGPLFSVELLGPTGEPINLRSVSRRWTPAYVLQEYESSGGIKMLERKTVLPSGVLVSELTVETDHLVNISLVAWSIQPAEPDTSAVRGVGTVAVPRRLPAPVGSSELVWLALALGPGESVVQVTPSEAGTAGPLWTRSALWETLKAGDQPEHIGRMKHQLHLGMRMDLELSPKTPIRLVAAMALATEREKAEQAARQNVRGDARPIEESLDAWEQYIAAIPQFRCSSEHVQRYYWYRWMGLRMAMQRPGVGQLKRRTVCEGPGYFRRAITYSLQAHLRELRWMKTSQVAQDTLFNFFDAQEEDGRIPGIIDLEGAREESFYHADWAGSVLDLLSIHPSREILVAAYRSLSRYAQWLRSTRDPEGVGLYAVENHYETGQEFSSRYQVVNPEADIQHWGNRFQLQGVDATTYAYELYRGLTLMAGMLGEEGQGAVWREEAERIKQAVLLRMWDSGDQMFYDVDSRTGNRTKVKAGTCFYPFMTDMPEEKHCAALEHHLLNPEEFWTEYPFPSLSMDDPMFNPLGLWKGLMRNCPWNGRSWPMLNSHLVEALARAGARLQPSLLPHAGEALLRTIRLLFLGGDAALPNCYEHYNPLTGKPCLYRTINDYQHSWVIDLILKYCAGLQPDPNGTLRVSPLPTGLEFVHVQGARVFGHEIDIEVADGRVISLHVDGEQMDTSGERIAIDLTALPPTAG